MMDKRTRTLNAMDCKPVDRVPASFYRHLFTFGDDEKAMIANQLKWFHESRMDFLLEETDGYMEFPMEGNPKEFANWKNLAKLGKNHPYFTGQIERTKRLLDGLDGACLFYILYTPFSTIKHTILDETTIMDFYREDKKQLSDVMKTIEEVTFELSERLMAETELTGFFVSLQNAEAERFAPEVYREYLSGWDERLLAKANSLSAYNITHMCSWGGVPNNMELWRDYDYKVVNWSVNIEKNLDLRQGRAYFKPGTCVMGGFDNRPNCVLHTGSEAEIKAMAKNQLELAGTTGTILCADCSVQNDQSAQNLRYVVEACEEFSASK